MVAGERGRHWCRTRVLHAALACTPPARRALQPTHPPTRHQILPGGHARARHQHPHPPHAQPTPHSTHAATHPSPGTARRPRTRAAPAPNPRRCRAWRRARRRPAATRSCDKMGWRWSAWVIGSPGSDAAPVSRGGSVGGGCVVGVRGGRVGGMAGGAASSGQRLPGPFGGSVMGLNSPATSPARVLTHAWQAPSRSPPTHRSASPEWQRSTIDRSKRPGPSGSIEKAYVTLAPAAAVGRRRFRAGTGQAGGRVSSGRRQAAAQARTPTAAAVACRRAQPGPCPSTLFAIPALACHHGAAGGARGDGRDDGRRAGEGARGAGGGGGGGGRRQQQCQGRQQAPRRCVRLRSRHGSSFQGSAGVRRARSEVGGEERQLGAAERAARPPIALQHMCTRAGQCGKWVGGREFGSLSRAAGAAAARRQAAAARRRQPCSIEIGRAGLRSGHVRVERQTFERNT